jgi:tRNA nucleotidyltransferase/poly(A) polymerase
MISLLRLFKEFAERHDIAGDAFIVGGAVRDILSGEYLKDIDIALKGDALGTAKNFSKEIGASFVILDPEFGIYRVVKKDRHIDICIMRGDSIYEDLSDRDITMNAMALPLAEIINHQSSIINKIIDPSNGMYDLSHGIIRMISEENLIKDPLRILRIYRFSAAPGFRIEEKTHNAVKRLAPLITSSAPERIAEELRHIIKKPDSYKTVGSMMNDNILIRILPEMSGSALQLYKNTEETINKETFSQYLADDYKKICLKMSALFADPSSAPSSVKNVAMRLKMSKKETEFLCSMVANRSRILSLREEAKGAPDDIKVIMLLKEFKEDIHAVAISGMAADPSAAGFWREAIAFYHKIIKPRMALLPVITGDDLKETFNVEPSPVFKKILSAIENAVLLGDITSREEALKKAGEMLPDS